MPSGPTSSLICLLQELLGGPGDTPYARSLTPSSTSSEVVVLGACCHMSFRRGRPSIITSEYGASMAPGSGYTLPCANVCEYVSREILNLEGVMNFSPNTIASGHGYSKTIPQ